MEEAIAYARKTTYTRCQLIGSIECINCSKSKRGFCNFKSRVEAYLAGRENKKGTQL